MLQIKNVSKKTDSLLTEKSFTQFTTKSSWSAICCCKQHIHYFPSCRCSTALPCHAADLVPLTFLLLRIISSYDLKKFKGSTFGYKKKKKAIYRAQH
jgi:hypothetical protein